MGTLSENAVWEDYIYRIQITDPILGGEDGVINVQPGQIANRTKYLYSTLSAQHSLSGHKIYAEQVAEDAAIAESKVAFDVPLSNISKALQDCGGSLQDLTNEVSELIGSDGMRIEALSRALQLLWQSGMTGFDWEFFSGVLTMMPPKRVKVLSTVAGDDTVIVEDSSLVEVGERFLLYSVDTPGKTEEVVVSKILTPRRVLMTEKVKQSMDDGWLGCTSWDTSTSPAVAAPNSVYMSHVSNALAAVPYGTFIIRRDKGVGVLTVEYREEDSDRWVKVNASSNEAVEDFYEESYILPGGRIQLRITNTGRSAVYITHMVLFASTPTRFVRPVKQPVVLSPTEDVFQNKLLIQSSEFKRAYGDNLSITEFYFQNDDADRPSYTYRIDGDTALPIDKEDAPQEGLYRVTCRHISDVGDVSDWSEELAIYVREPKVFFAFKGAEYGSGFDANQFYTLKHDTIRFGFAGSAESAGFDEAMFVLA